VGVFPFKRMLDEQGIRYRNDPALEEVRERLDRFIVII